MKIYNTLSGKIENFIPLKKNKLALYTCGPTVYDYSHIGHIRTYIGSDVLKRAFSYLGYDVNHIMNITDVGHLVSDADEGEDKLEKGAKKSGKSVWDVAKFYTDYFLNTIKQVDVIPPSILAKATDHIQEMIDLIKILEKNGYTYTTEEAVYFDISKFPDYGTLSHQKIQDKLTGAREEVKVDKSKKNPADFALWFKRTGRFADHAMHWDSPWGDGFPGWHIECSAMSMKYLGDTIDIHTGGVDHIPVHHENEIAQSQAATGKQFVRYWIHYNHLYVDGKKMSKSLGNFYTIDDVLKKGIAPHALRLLFLQTHYRQEMNFTWEAALAANNAYSKLKDRVRELRTQTTRQMLSEDKLGTIDKFGMQFRQALENDLQIPQALAVMWEALKSSIPSEDKLDLIYEFDKVFGLGLGNIDSESIPEEIEALAQSRKLAKKSGEYNKADELRNLIKEKGYSIEDTAEGYKIKKSV